MGFMLLLMTVYMLLHSFIELVDTKFDDKIMKADAIAFLCIRVGLGVSGAIVLIQNFPTVLSN